MLNPVRKTSVTRAFLWLAASEVASKGASLARAAIVAHAIGPSEFGVAMVLWLTLALFEMISNTGVDKLLVQADPADATRLARTAQSLQLVRGMAAACFLWFAAPVIAAMLADDRIEPMFHGLSLIPLLRGLQHLDIYRLQRGYRFGPASMVEMVSQLTSLALAWPISRAMPDASCMLVLMVIQTLAAVVLSHALAERKCEWGWSREDTRTILRFGWPLLINGLLMFVIFQGDQIVVGLTYGPGELGIYAAAFAVASAPVMILARIATSMLLPTLSHARSDAARFEQVFNRASSLLASVAVAAAAPLILLGDFLLSVVYGPAFASGNWVLALLAIMQASRVIRIASTIASMALGDNRNGLVSNVARCLAMIPFVIAVAAGTPVEVLALGGIVAESVAIVISLRQLSPRAQVHVGFAASSAIGGLLVCGLLMGLAWALRPSLAVALLLTGIVTLLSGWFVLHTARVGADQQASALDLRKTSDNSLVTMQGA